jgi:LysM repeat protein
MASGKITGNDKLKPSAVRYVPVAQVSFHTEKQCYQIRGASKGASAVQDPTDRLISITTTKTLDSPAGTFNIALAGDNWFMPDEVPVLKPNDLVVIYMGYKAKGAVQTWLDGSKHIASEDLDTVMIGLIDTVTRVRSGGGSGSVPSIVTTIVGRDFGKLLIKPTLKFYPQLGVQNTNGKFFLTNTGWITLMKTFTNDNTIKGSPAKILDTILRFVLKKLVKTKWKIYDDSIGKPSVGYKVVDISNMIRYKLAETNFFTPFLMTAQEYEGSIWNLMERVNIKPFTEMFIDTRDRWEVANDIGVPATVNGSVEEDSSHAKGQLSEDKGKWAYPPARFGEKDGGQVLLTYRNTPFDKVDWEKLRSHEVEAVDVDQETLSYSDSENYNLFWAGSTLSPFGIDLKQVAPPLINEDNITRYGLSPLEVSVEGLLLDKSTTGEQSIALDKLSKELNTRLKVWYQNNINYLSGSLALRGKGSVKVGQRLNYKTINREFYIESVTQNFQVYGSFSTQCGITRGAITGQVPALILANKTPTTVAKAVTATQKTTVAIAGEYYTVKKGDTLAKIAGVKYGTATMWTKLWEANKVTLIERDKRNKDAHGQWIYPGQVLKIPK